MSDNTKRIQVRLPDDEYEKLKTWAKKLGVTMGQLGGMAVQAGLGGILRAVSPIDSIKPAQWADIIEAMEVKKSDENQKLEAVIRDE